MLAAACRPGVPEVNARRLVLILAFVSVACGSSSLSPTGDAAQQPAGTWIGTISQTTASGSTTECLLAFQTITTSGPDTISLTITQNGTALTATAVSASSGQVCAFTGGSSGNNINLTATACNPQAVQFTCNGLARDVYLTSRTYAGIQNTNVMTGSGADTWNVFNAGDTVTVLNVVKTTSTFTLRR
jgi:hypothetical protein